MKSKPIGALFGVLALVAVIAVAQPAYAANVQVTISSGASNTKGACTSTDCFNPQVVNVNVGDTVTWTNADTVGHTATSGKPSDNQTGTVFDSSLISAGKSYTTPAFTTAGTYSYFCQVHPWMTGEIIVGAAGATSPATTSSSNMTGTSNMTTSNMTTSNASSQAVPEFGPVASLVLVLAIISVVIFTSKTRGFLKL
ncbi:MAG: PEFG-CTERM sorting domain-containing protein [Thaumarchaeota archaeon]|nr:PEFG-CTERM sorting domain-containing protein [Nitrososphaerota archaeon]